MIAYCVMAHRSPSQVKRLVQRLLDDDPDCRVVLHYDLSQGGGPLTVDDQRVHGLASRPRPWGSPEGLDLQLAVLQAAMELGASYAVLLSGQDYPLRSVAGLEQVLSAYDVWATMWPLGSPSDPWPSGRSHSYQYQWARVRNPGLAARGFDRALRTFGVGWPEQRTPLLARTWVNGERWWGVRTGGPGLPVYGGSDWMNLSAAALRAVFGAGVNGEHVPAPDPKLFRYFRRTLHPHEACLQTILANTSGLRLAPDYARFIRWPEQGGPHPEVLTSADVPAMIASGAHFARKFDIEVDADVLATLDRLASGQRVH